MPKKGLYPQVLNITPIFMSVKDRLVLCARNRSIQTLSFFVFYLALSAIKSRSFLLEGRFWAEEGAVFYPGVQNNFWFLFNGHLELPTNIVVYLSTLVDLKYASLVTSYLSFAFQSIPIVMLVVYREQFKIKRFALLAVLIISVGLPQSNEVWANAVNLHFHFALLVALIAALPFTDNYPKKTVRGLLFLSGLSGVPANFLVPIYLLRIGCVKNNEVRIQAAILVCTTIIQLTLLFFNYSPSDARGLSFEPAIIMLALASQQIISPLVGSGAAELITHALRSTLSWGIDFIMLFVLACSSVLFLYKRIMFSRVHGAIALSLCGLVLTVASLTTALGDKIDFISPWGHGRYLYAPNILFFLSLGLIVSAVRQRVLYTVLCLACVASAVYGVKSAFYGPNWNDAYARAKKLSVTTVEIWPPGWGMPMKGGDFSLISGGLAKPEDYISNCKANCMVMLSVKDEGSANLTMGFKTKMMEAGSVLIEKLSYRDSYVALIVDGELIEEKLRSDSYVELGYENGKHDIKFFSAGYHTGDASKIEVNGVDLSPNSRGVNIVSINYDQKQYLTQAFDTYAVVY
ncbi:MAG: hypothetical protein KUG73_08045 [Pseudomonadales bacterium]|nr:hypothetical protein [Pseudomonadales bacterium]